METMQIYLAQEYDILLLIQILILTMHQYTSICKTSNRVSYSISADHKYIYIVLHINQKRENRAH